MKTNANFNLKSKKRNSKLVFILAAIAFTILIVPTSIALTIFTVKVSAKQLTNIGLITASVNTDWANLSKTENNVQKINSTLENKKNRKHEKEINLSQAELNVLIEPEKEKKIKFEYWMIDFDNNKENYDFLAEEREEKIELKAWMMDMELFSKKFENVYFTDDTCKYVSEIVEEKELALENWMLKTELFEEMVRDAGLDISKILHTKR